MPLQSIEATRDQVKKLREEFDAMFPKRQRQPHPRDEKIDDGDEGDALQPEEVHAILQHIVYTRGVDQAHVSGLLATAARARENENHADAVQTLRQLAAMVYPSSRATGASDPERVPAGEERRTMDAVATVDLDAAVDAALDRPEITDTSRRIGAKLEAQRTGHVPPWLPREAREITAHSPLLDRVNARLSELNTDPIVQIALKMQAAMEGQEPEIMKDTQRMNGLRRRN